MQPSCAAHAWVSIHTVCLCMLLDKKEGEIEVDSLQGLVISQATYQF